MKRGSARCCCPSPSPRRRPKRRRPELADDETQAVEATAVRLLAAREHSRAELTRKLASRGLDADLVAQVLDDLARQGLQSDDRYVACYVDERMGKGFGPRRIEAELKERGVDADLIRHHMDRDEETWRELMLAAHDRKFGPGPADGRSELARRARFLEYRGFTSAQVSRFLRFDDC